MELRHTETDGIPTLVCPASGTPRVSLLFRVGRADETLASTGITHLVEHLTLTGQVLSDYHVNGMTGPVVTAFHAEGASEDISTFLAGVCASLASLPVERLAIEKQILRTEAAGRNGSASEQLPRWRYGARGHGLVSYRELGLDRITADDVRQWAQTWFTRDNAVLCIVGEVPTDLRLSLPAGQRRAVPEPTAPLSNGPGYFQGPNASVAFDGVVPRGAGVAAYCHVLERVLFRTLRQDAGLSYATQAVHAPRGDGYSTITAAADALPDTAGAVLGGVVDALLALDAGRIDQADLDAATSRMLSSLGRHDAEVAALHRYAVDILTGQPPRSLEQTRADVSAVTLDAVHQVATRALKSGLLMVPRGLTAEWAGFTAVTTHSAQRASGRAHRSLQHAGLSLIVGADAVSMVEGEEAVTVAFAKCAAALAWPDGARQLIGDDAIAIAVEPTLFDTGGEAVEAIDGALPQDRVIAMPARDPDTIPQPKAGGARSRTEPGTSRSWPQWLYLLYALLTVALLIASTRALSEVGKTLDEPQSTGTVPPGTMALWVLTGVAIVGWFGLMLWKKHRARRPWTDADYR